MIVVDTSALMAIVLDEPTADACVAALEAEDDLLMSAGTMACFRARLLASFGSPTRARTWDLRINSPSLYQLSYRGRTADYSVTGPGKSNRLDQASSTLPIALATVSMLCSFSAARQIRPVLSA